MGWFTPNYSTSSSRHHHHSSSSSYYKRRPRDGYIQRLIHQIRRIIRDLIHYAKRHPMKVFMMFVMPLLTGGALTGVLKTLGIRLPPGVFGGRGGGSSYGGSYSGRSSAGGLADLAGGGGVQGLLKIAQAFM